MKILTSNYWKQFKKTVKYKNGTVKRIKDGNKFEDLVKKLLDLEYGDNHWKPTLTTHDGSRDFEYRTRNFYKWAECKNYETGISLNIISNTLVMALIDFADEVLIFSYSKIKKPVLNKLIQYADVSQKILRIYADDSLEMLILKYIDILKDEFFPSFNPSTIHFPNLSPFISCNVIADPVTAYTMNFDARNIAKSPNEINYNSVMCLCIAIYNPKLTEIEITIQIKWEKCNNIFDVLNDKYQDTYKISVNRSSTHIEKIFFTFAKYREKIDLPYAIINYDGTAQIFAFPKAKCSWVGECILQGSTYRNIRNVFPSKVLNGSFFSIIHIYGTSGSGKSRMLAEFENIALGYGYRVVRFNIEKIELANSIAIKMITEFICAIYDIPNVNDLVQTDDYNKYGNVFSMLTRLSGKDNLLHEEYEEILLKILKKLQTAKCYISLDNIQYYPEQFISFLLDLLKRLMISNNACNSRMGFVINTDYLHYQSKHDEMYSFLISSKDRIASYRLDGFKETGEAQTFLNQLLSDSQIMDKYIEKILCVCSNSPYFIQSLLVSLETEGILVRQNDGYILPEDRHQEFYQKVDKINEINEIIEKRWIYYLEKHDLEENLYIISILHIFRRLDNEIITQFSLSRKIIDELCKYHFLCKNDTLKFSYEFEHDLTENYFSKTYFPLCKYAYSCNADIQISNPIFCHLRKLVAGSFVSIDECKCLWKQQIPYKLGYEFYSLFIKKVLDTIQSENDIDSCLEMIFSICVSCRELYGTEASLMLYDQIIHKIEIDFPDYQKHVNWAWEIASYCNVLYEHNEYQKAIDYMKRILAFLKDEPSKICGYVYNRLHVYERAMSVEILEQTYKWLEKSEEIQKACGIIELEFTNYIDRGYCAYCDAAHREQVLLFWGKACDLYENNDLTSKKMNYIYHKIHILMLKGEYDNVLEMISYGFEVINKQEEGVYYITYFSERYLLCKIACLLMLHEKYSLDQVTTLFQQVEEYNYKLQSRSDYTMQFLKAIFCFYQNDFLNAILCLQKAKILLQKHKKLTFQGKYLDHLYANVKCFTIQWLIFDKKIVKLDAITDSAIKRRMLKIINMSEKSRSDFWDSYNAKSIFQSIDGKINYPVL